MEAQHLESKPGAKRKNGLDYLLHVPAGYARSRRKWPLVLFLHGSGERGNDVWKVARHGPPKLVKRGQDLPVILASPQCPAGSRWAAHYDTLLALVDSLVERLRIDPDRVYLTGLSMGGYGTWEMGTTNAQRFAALLPICGGARPGFKFAEHAAALKTMPLWCFHGAQDDVVPLGASERLIKHVRAAGGDPKFTIYPRLRHDSWTKTYANPKVWDWLLAQRR